MAMLLNQRVPQTMARIPWDQRLRLGVALTSWRRHLATAVPTARPWIFRDVSRKTSCWILDVGTEAATAQRGSIWGWISLPMIPTIFRGMNIHKSQQFWRRVGRSDPLCDDSLCEFMGFSRLNSVSSQVSIRPKSSSAIRPPQLASCGEFLCSGPFCRTF